MTKQTSTVLFNIGELVSLQPLKTGDWPRQITEKHLGLMQRAWIAFENGKVVECGVGSPPAADLSVDANGGLVLPGLIDAHTHPLFAGSRANEFVMRSQGATYQQIAAAGGGIRATLKATRAASTETLIQSTASRLQAMLKNGVTAVEVKTGYGLSVAEELRHLQVYKNVQDRVSMALSVTALPLHAMPPEEKNQADFVSKMQTEFLTELSKQKNTGQINVDSVDAFVEEGYFSEAEGEGFFKRAQNLGLDLRVHADEFSRSGGARLAARLGAASADHLQFASREDAEAMAEAGVVAVLLPGTSLYTRLPFSQGRMFIDAGCRLAVATDFNPGSCYIHNLPQLMSLAAIHSGITAEEAMVAVTLGAASSIKRFHKKGYLAAGADADFIVLPFANWQEYVADFGQTKPGSVFIAGVKQNC